MKIIFILFVISMLWACSKEEIIVVDGDWQVDYWEVSGCLDSISNFTRDLALSNCIDEDSIINCYDYTLSFGQNNAFSSSLEILEDSTNITQFDRIGQYELTDNNTMVLCRPDCDTLIFIREDNILNIIMPTDSLSGCGEYIRAFKI